MARESYRVVVCGDCGTTIDEPPPRSGFRPERLPCPNCGGTAREYRLGLTASVSVSGGVTIVAPVAEATATAPAPVVSVEEKVETGTFTRTVIWSKNPDAWLAEVRDSEGNLVGVQLGFDSDDVYLDLHGDLTPPKID